MNRNCETHFNVKSPGLCAICLIEERDRLKKALEPFAMMDRDGCDLSEIACERGTASDRTVLTSRDFRLARLALLGKTS